MIDVDALELEWSEDDRAWHVLDVGGLTVWIRPMAFNHRVVFAIKSEDLSVRVANGYLAGWCYPDLAEAFAAVARWIHDPIHKPDQAIKESFCPSWSDVLELFEDVVVP